MEEILKIFIMLFCVIGVETLLLIFIMMKTPAMPFLSLGCFVGAGIVWLITLI